MSSSSLTSHDHAVIEAINLLGMASTGHIARLVFSHTSPTSQNRQCRRTLKRLHDMGLIGRLPRSIGGLGSEGFTYIPARSEASRLEPHAIDVATLYCQLIEAEREGLLKILDFETEDFIVGTRTKFDAYLWVETSKGKRDMYIELDRGSHKGPATRAKFRVYSNAYKRASKSFPAVLYVVSFAPRDRINERIGVLKQTAKAQEVPKLFAVCSLQDLVGTICC